MRIALCLSGLVGGTQKYGGGEVVDYRLAFHSFRKNIFEKGVEGDVFIHSWSVDYEKPIVNLYQPRGYCFERQIDFGSQYAIKEFAILSKNYSNKQVLSLKQKYEREKGFKYDWVFLTRLDLTVDKKIDYSLLSNQKFYVNGPKRPHGKRCKCGFCDETSPQHCVDDLIFFSSSGNMDLLGEAFDHLHEYGLKEQASNHIMMKKHLVKTGLWPRVDYYFKNIPNRYPQLWLFLKLPVPFCTNTPLIRWKFKRPLYRFLDRLILFTGSHILFFCFNRFFELLRKKVLKIVES